jgi:hypothetical protein
MIGADETFLSGAGSPLDPLEDTVQGTSENID